MCCCEYINSAWQQILTCDLSSTPTTLSALGTSWKAINKPVSSDAPRSTEAAVGIRWMTDWNSPSPGLILHTQRHMYKHTDPHTTLVIGSALVSARSTKAWLSDARLNKCSIGVLIHFHLVRRENWPRDGGQDEAQRDWLEEEVCHEIVEGQMETNGERREQHPTEKLRRERPRGLSVWTWPFLQRNRTSHCTI